MEKLKVNTIGFTKTSAHEFFKRLGNAGVKKLIDVRLNNTSQLSGFAKAVDLKFFLKEISGISYEHLPILAPENSMLKDYRNGAATWAAYSDRFLELMETRRIESKLNPESFADSCLLCSEDQAHHCHRRLVVEYLNDKWKGALDIRHI
ncbi:DUF488 domain-containing protein [Devosia sp. J2-20]|uniref:DUF488 domain-containing protein n=1 Tax=Devosia sp. J2-20 TaxID=3026161 RepID=UPI00249B40E4|nr:DUF488 domain-containing protein [Devosia sp. J2-20]WDR00451.1 DUF488 domain-containing protein [Devosia sp. J2-20]